MQAYIGIAASFVFHEYHRRVVIHEGLKNLPCDGGCLPRAFVRQSRFLESHLTWQGKVHRALSDPELARCLRSAVHSIAVMDDGGSLQSTKSSERLWLADEAAGESIGGPRSRHLAGFQVRQAGSAREVPFRFPDRTLALTVVPSLAEDNPSFPPSYRTRSLMPRSPTPSTQSQSWRDSGLALVAPVSHSRNRQLVSEGRKWKRDESSTPRTEVQGRQRAQKLNELSFHSTEPFPA